MCLIIFSWDPANDRPLIVGANRDEFHQRPSQDAHFWPDAPHIFAGRDLQMLGTWLGLAKNSDNSTFRLAALTNVRQADTKTYSHSRGELTRFFLESDQSALDYCHAIMLERYAGFNGIFYDGLNLIYIHHSAKYAAEIRALAPGNYALSNAKLDTPWPKVQQSRLALDKIRPDQSIEQTADILFSHLGNTQIASDESLPDTGIALTWERMLSAAFIISPEYGTRTSTAVIIQQEQGLELSEQRKQSAFFIEHQYLKDGTKNRSLFESLT